MGRRIIGSKLVAVAVLSLLASCAAKPGDFRSSRWGMSREEVRRAEAAEMTELQDGNMELPTLIGKYDGSAIFEFFADRLVSGRYVLLHHDSESLQKAFADLQELITSKYGEPERRDPQTCSWSTGRTSIMLSLYRNSDPILEQFLRNAGEEPPEPETELLLSYTSKEHEAEIRSSRLKGL